MTNFPSYTSETVSGGNKVQNYLLDFQHFIEELYFIEGGVSCAASLHWDLQSRSQPNADMAHCLTSVGHCGYFCRASVI